MADRAPTGVLAYAIWRFKHLRCLDGGPHNWLIVHERHYDRECLACGIQD